MTYVSRISFFMLIIFILFLAGCSAPIHVYLNAAGHINPDEKNQSLPVQVKIYQLKDKDAFKEATFAQLWQEDAKTLGGSLLEKRVITLNPKQKERIILTRNNACHYLGVVAIFRQPRGNSWRLLAKIETTIPGLYIAKSINIYGSSIIAAKS